MNPPYHHSCHPDLNSPRSPNSDSGISGYRGHTPLSGPPSSHMSSPRYEHIHQHPAYVPVSQNNESNSQNNYHRHQHYFNFLSNNNSDNSSDSTKTYIHSNSNNNNSNFNCRSTNTNTATSNSTTATTAALTTANNNNGNNNSIINNDSNNNDNNSTSQNHGSAICAGCNTKIMDRFLLKAMDRHWHNACLKCQMCNRNLADLSGSCFTKDDMILCRADYIRVFGHQGACTNCRQTIPPSDYVMRVGGGSIMDTISADQALGEPHVYHLSCFNCVKCNARLEPGDKYCVLTNGQLVCERDWNSVFRDPNASLPGQQFTTGGTIRKGKVGRPRRSRD